jgi:hypothetical protein
MKINFVPQNKGSLSSQQRKRNLLFEIRNVAKPSKTRVKMNRPLLLK